MWKLHSWKIRLESSFSRNHLKGRLRRNIDQISAWLCLAVVAVDVLLAVGAHCSKPVALVTWQVVIIFYVIAFLASAIIIYLHNVNASATSSNDTTLNDTSSMVQLDQSDDVTDTNMSMPAQLVTYSVSKVTNNLCKITSLNWRYFEI